MHLFGCNKLYTNCVAMYRNVTKRRLLNKPATHEKSVESLSLTANTSHQLSEV